MLYFRDVLGGIAREWLSTSPDSRQRTTVAEFGLLQNTCVACSLFIPEKGKPVVRPGRKAVGLDIRREWRGRQVTEWMIVCHAVPLIPHGRKSAR